MTTRLPILLLVLACALSLAPAPPDAAGEEKPARPAPVRGILYHVWHGDWIHQRGQHFPEVHVPDLGLSFSLVGGELRVFRPKDPDGRYGTKKVEVFEIPKEDGTTERIEVPFLYLKGLEPRRIREIEIAPDDARTLREFLASKDRVRRIAAKYARQGR